MVNKGNKIKIFTTPWLAAGSWWPRAVPASWVGGERRKPGARRHRERRRKEKG